MIDEQLGSMADFDALRKNTKKKGNLHLCALMAYIGLFSSDIWNWGRFYQTT